MIESNLKLKKAKRGFEYIIYEPPIAVKKEDVMRLYNAGGLLYYKDIEGNEDEILVAAYVKLYKAYGALRLAEFFIADVGKEVCMHNKVEILDPVPLDTVDFRKYEVFSADEFFDSYTETIQNSVFDTIQAFNLDEKDLHLYLKINLVNKGIAYYGYCVGELSEEKKKEMPEGCISIGYDILVSGNYHPLADDDELDDSDLESIIRENSFQDALRNSQKLPQIAYEIRLWMSNTSFNDFLAKIKERVRGQAQVDVVIANVYTYLRCVANGVSPNSNMLIAAPSGCGKTETYRAVRDYMAEALPHLPVYQLDITSITEEGFKGKDTSAIVKPLLEHHETNGIGIVFIDEFDKKLLPSYSAGGGDVNAAVQAQILTLIEGRVVTEDKTVVTQSIDTSNTLFIGLGAFNPCRKKKTEAHRAVGFGEQNGERAKYYDDITREDMIDIGASYELLGRFASVINYHELSDEAVDEIVDMQIKKVSDSLGYQVKVGKEMRKFLHENANSKYGCRMLESILREAAMESYLELLKSGSPHGAVIEVY